MSTMTLYIGLACSKHGLLILFSFFSPLFSFANPLR